MRPTLDGKAAAVIAYCRSRGYPEPDVEFRFHPARKFAFDLAFVAERLAVEFEGGTYGRGKPCPVCKRRAGGAHSSVAGMKRDHEKYSLAACLGWRVIHCRPEQVGSGELFAWLDLAFGGI
jgi:hypothetical protein